MIERIGKKLSIQDMLALRQYTLDMLPAGIPGLSQVDAVYHYNERERWIDLNQVEAFRNLYFHRRIISKVALGLDSHNVVLELGGGVGYDAQMFFKENMQFDCYIFSDVSAELVEYVRGREQSSLPVVFCSLDATDLMIEDNQVDVIYMIAALHHFPQLETALHEMSRVGKPRARFIFGMEPNRLWTRLMVKARLIYRPLFTRKEHSAADEEADGFSVSDFKDIANQTGWELQSLEPVWFLCGFIHYGLEFIYRLFRMKKRIRLPDVVEGFFVGLDELFFKLPFTHALAWHYTACYQKME